MKISSFIHLLTKITQMFTQSPCVDANSQYEDDIEDGQYEKYLSIIHPSVILGTMTGTALWAVDETAIQALICAGLDINSIGDYCSDTNAEIRPIISACEFRCIPMLKGLLDNGALTERHQGNSPLEFALQGHSFGDVCKEYTGDVEECVRLLINSGSTLELRADIFGDMRIIKTYSSQYLSSLEWKFI